ncbi:hypothetical protein Q3G72_004691 [Acer saccharum]|nr:hypothetical protein Q3G72_004691 [Acer saccharum]
MWSDNGVTHLYLLLLLACFMFALHVNSVLVERSTHIIHMDLSSMPKTFTSLQNWHSSIIDSLKPTNTPSSDGHHSSPALVYSYENAAHGFSAILSQQELETLKKLPGFVSAYSDKNVTLDTTHTPEFLSLNIVSGLWPASNYGEDVIVGTARGLAPRARLAMYKVIFDEGRYASDVLAGMDQAIADGVNVISISMGFDGVPLYEDPIAVASFAAMEKGVVVSSSAGNDGPSLGTLHNGIPWVLTVAAGTIDRSFAGTVTLGNGQTIVGWTMFPASAFVENVPLVYNKTYSACNSSKLLSKAPLDAIIVCEETGFFEDQLNLICAFNFRGAIFVSKETDLGGVSCPGVVISPEDAPAVLNYAKIGNTSFASIKFQQTVLGTKPAPAVASYTSRGPSPSYPGILKPDVMAPGSLVLAAWIPHDYTAQIGSNVLLSSDYNMISGTSMACPHASGVAALLKALYNNKTASYVQTFNRTVTNVGEGAATYKATVTAPKGSTVVVSPEKLVFENKYEKQSYTLTIKYKKDDEENVSFGALVWIEESGKFTVRSPIAVSPFLTSV